MVSHDYGYADNGKAESKQSIKIRQIDALTQRVTDIYSGHKGGKANPDEEPFLDYGKLGETVYAVFGVNLKPNDFWTLTPRQLAEWLYDQGVRA